jgi:hypothetical protein
MFRIPASPWGWFECALNITCPSHRFSTFGSPWFFVAYMYLCSTGTCPRSGTVQCTGVLSYLQMYSTTSDSSTEYWSSVIFCRVLWVSRYGTVSIYSRTYHGTQRRPVFSRVLKSSLGTHRKCSSKFFGHQVSFYVDVVQSQSQLWE